jgi:uncharacterized protein (UPF0303 family)
MIISGFTSKGFLEEHRTVMSFNSLNINAIEISKIVITPGNQRDLPIVIELGIGEQTSYLAFLARAKAENDWRIEHQVVVVSPNINPTMYERVTAEELGVDWHLGSNQKDKPIQFNRGVILLTSKEGLKGVFINSGLPNAIDHLFAVEVLIDFLAQKGGKFSG